MARVGGEPDVAVVRPGQDLRLGVAVDPPSSADQADERLVGVVLPVDAPDLPLVQVLFQQAVAGSQGTPHDPDGGDGEVQTWVGGVEVEFLDQLRQVPVAHRRVGPHDPGPLRVVGGGGGLRPSLRRAHLEIDHRFADQAPAVQGPEGQQGDDGVAASAAGVAGGPQFLPVQFGHPIDELVQPLGGRMHPTVPAGVVRRVPQPEVRREVDDPPGEAGEAVDTVHRLPVGEGQEEQVAWLQVG